MAKRRRRRMDGGLVPAGLGAGIGRWRRCHRHSFFFSYFSRPFPSSHMELAWGQTAAGGALPLEARQFCQPRPMPPGRLPFPFPRSFHYMSFASFWPTKFSVPNRLLFCPQHPSNIPQGPSMSAKLPFAPF